MKLLLLAVATLFALGCQPVAPENTAKLPFYDERDCLSPMVVGNDPVYEFYKGITLQGGNLPAGQFHRFRVISEPHPNAPAYLTIVRPNGWKRCHAGNAGQTTLHSEGNVKVFAGSGCFHPPEAREIQGCPTNYGYLLKAMSIDNQPGHLTAFLKGPQEHTAEEAAAAEEGWNRE